jgi:hypothetical protein
MKKSIPANSNRNMGEDATNRNILEKNESY